MGTAAKRLERIGGNRILWGALSFVLPVLVFLFVQNKIGFYPFGEKSMLIMDMRDQYVEFFASLRNVLFGDNSLFFSWSRSMGGNYWGIFTYYIASPLSFLTLFFPVEQMPLAIELLTVLKLGLCGLTFFVYASYLAARGTGILSGDGKTPAWVQCILLVLSLCYALMSYNMVYSMSLMWLDGVILLPLILMGMEQILRGEKKGGLYLVALAALLISNYYTGYMVGLYTGMYLIFRVLSGITRATWKEWLFKVLRYAILSVLAIGIAAPVILGALKDLMQGKLAGGGSGFTLDLSLRNFDSFADFAGKLQNGVYDSITNAGLPAVYCGYAVLVLAVVFFLLRGITWREKIGMALILVVLGVSFSYTSLDMVWHGFQTPNWFPYRYAFLFSFSMLYMACRAFLALAGKDGRTGQKWKKLVRVSCAVLLLCLVPAEMAGNAESMLLGLDGEFRYRDMGEYNEVMDHTKPLVDEIKEEDDGFYRINQGYEFSKNDAMLLGYHGMTHYSSTFNAAVNSLTPRLGISQGYFWNSGYGSNALLDSLFSVKYILADKTVPASYTEHGRSDGGKASYENPLSLPIAYGSTPSTLAPDLYSASPFENQNRLLSAIAGEETACFTNPDFQMSQNGSSWNYTFTAASANPVYLYMRADGVSYANVYVNEGYVGDYFTNETNGTIFLGNFTPGQEVSVRVDAAEGQNAAVRQSEIAELHMEILEPVLARLGQNGLRVERHRNGALAGTISLEEGQIIVTSIPYDTGWEVTIDGEGTEPQLFAGTFMAVECPAGEHEVRFSYTSPGVMTGFVIGILSLILSALYLNSGRLSQAVRSRLAPDAMR